MTNDDVQGPPDYPDEPPDDMSQEEQALLLVEPAFDHQVDHEADLLAEEFGPPDDDGWYGRDLVYATGGDES